MFSLSLVHMSDLHFGKKSRFVSTNLPQLGIDCAEAIKETMQEKFQKPAPDFVVVTGDITERGLKKEFIKANIFFRSFRKSMDIASSSFIFIHGNHDISWKACQKYFNLNKNKKKNTYYRDLEQKKLKYFMDFKKSFYLHNEPVTRLLNKGSLLYEYGGMQACIVALNSCELITDKSPLGSVSSIQAKRVMDELKDRYDNFIRIIALHHPIYSSADRNEYWIQKLEEQFRSKELTEESFIKFKNDALSVEGHAAIERIIEERNIHILLHGHQHTNEEFKEKKWKKYDYKCQICPAGSFGMSRDGLPSDQPNCLRLIHFYEEGERIKLKSVSLEYDPWAKPDDSILVGRFEVKGEEQKAEYPLIIKRTISGGSPDNDFEGENDVDQVTINRARKKIKTIMQSDPGFYKTFKEVYEECDNEKELADRLIQNGLNEVWGIIVDDFELFLNYFDKLKRVLFLLVQCSIKKDAFDQVRKKLKLEEEFNIFESPILYPVMAEIILKTAFGSEITVDWRIKKDGPEVIAKNMLYIPETGIDETKKKKKVIDKILDAFPELRNLPEEIQGKRMSKRLYGLFRGKRPFFLVHYNSKGLSIPYLVEFIIPSNSKDTFPERISPLTEDTLYQFINDILERISEQQK